MGVYMSFKRIAPVEFVTLLQLAHEQPESSEIPTILERLPECTLDKEWMALQNMFSYQKHFSIDMNTILFNEDEMISELSVYIQSYYIKPSDVKLVFGALSETTMAKWLDRYRIIVSKRANRDFIGEEQQGFVQTMAYISDLFMFLDIAVENGEGIIRIDDV